MSAQSARSATLFSIGQVLQRLNPEFPDLSPSKLRYLEDQGLVEPSRTPSGYRKFSPADLERLRAILTLQRDHFMPLKVIRAYFDDVDAGRRPQLPGGNVDLVSPSILSADLALDRAELLERSGASRPLLAGAVQAGLVGPAEPYDEQALHVLTALASLAEFGIEPRHLRGMRQAAQREAALIEQAVKPLAGRRETGSRARAADAARELAGHIQAIRQALSTEALEQLR